MTSTWTCPNGHTGETDFCPWDGTPRPAEVAERDIANGPANEDIWRDPVTRETPQVRQPGEWTVPPPPPGIREPVNADAEGAATWSDSSSDAPQPKKSQKGRRITLGTAALLVVVIAVAAVFIIRGTGRTELSTPATAGGAAASQASNSAVPPIPTTTAPISSGPATTFGDGSWVVGKDIAPGTYTTMGKDGCYWERERDTSGLSASILANDTGSGPSVVTILPTDGGFKSLNCGEWSPLPSSGPQSTSFGDGIWAVGITIAPGTYHAAGGAGCYWERERDFTAKGTTSIIAIDTPSGPATVTVAATDKAFKSQGCGTWSKQ